MTRSSFFLSCLCALVVIIAPASSFAEPYFTITPIFLPTQFNTNSFTDATYTVTNNTGLPLTGVGIKNLIPGAVSQDTSGTMTPPVCANPMNFTASGSGASCTLQIRVSAPITNYLPQVCFSSTNPVYCSQPPNSAALTVIQVAGTIPRYAYVTNGVGNTVYICPINETNGTFGACKDSGVGAIFDFPERIVINSSDTLAYVTNFFGNTVTKCSVNSTTGAFSNCVDSGAGAVFVNPVGISLNSAGTQVYIDNSGNNGHPTGSNTVTICTVNSNGTLSNCADSGATGAGFSVPWGNIINSAGTFAYVANDYANPPGNPSGNNITVCPINKDTGYFGSCFLSGNTGIAFGNPRGVILNNANTIAYVTNGGHAGTTGNFVSLCPINSNGSFGDCVDSGVGAVFNEPEELSLNRAGTYAYIPNANNSTVSVCSINLTTGYFQSCVDSGNSGLAFDYPVTAYLIY